MRPPILSKYPVDKIINNFKSSKDKEMWIVRFIPQLLNKQKIMIWKSKISNEKETTPGKIIECEDSIKVSTGNGCIELISLQVENEPICDAKLFLKSYQIKYGDMFKTTI